MSVACEPLPKQLAEEMLQLAARALCDRPGDNPAQRDSRTRQMVHSVMGMQPRDGLEFMLSTMLVGHFETIMDAMREGLQSPVDPSKAKTRSSITGLVRSMTSLMRELRIERKRPLMRWPVTADAATEAAAPEMAKGDRPSAPEPTPPGPATETPDSAPSVPHPSPSADPGPTRPHPGDIEAAMPVRSSNGHDDGGNQKNIQWQPEAATSPNLSLAAIADDAEPDDGTIKEHLRMFDDAMSAMNEILEELRVPADAKPAAMAMNGTKAAV